MTKRYRRAYVSVDVDVSEVLSDLDDDQLIEELEARGKTFAADEPILKGCEDALAALNRGDVEEATTILERITRPKWVNVEECQRQYDLLRAACQ